MSEDALHASLKDGIGTVCYAWAISLRDGKHLGFTDHDLPLTFDDIRFQPNSGFSARSLVRTTGLSVDNTEVIGGISHAVITDADIEAGLYDFAEVRAWLVNWRNPSKRRLEFRGLIGEIRRKGAEFQAELRGLTSLLNRPLGRIYQKPCSAVLGDRRCKIDIAKSKYSSEFKISDISDAHIYWFHDLSTFQEGWFAKGLLQFVPINGAEQNIMIKRDTSKDDRRCIELWQAPRVPLKIGDTVRLSAGCDKSFDTCLTKFANGVNFRGFPDIPNEEWMYQHPAQSKFQSGGSRR